MNALDLLRSCEATRPLSCGCKVLDRAIGGISMRGITEVAGEAGCGKTQFCLSMSLQVQLDADHGGKSGAAAYLSCGEGIFPIRRLSQLAAEFESRTSIPSQQFLSNVHIEQCYNIDDAQAILRHKIPELCQQRNVKLLIIDSLAGLVRFEYDSRSAQDMRARTVLLFALARELKLLSDIFKIGVVVVNQVTGDFRDELPPMAGLGSGSSHTSRGLGSSSGFGGGGSVPALGMAWAYCVNTRITLHRDSTRARACPPPPQEEQDGEGEDTSVWAAALTGTSTDVDETGFAASVKEEGKGEHTTAVLGAKRPLSAHWKQEQQRGRGLVGRGVDDTFYTVSAQTDSQRAGAVAAEGDKENAVLPNPFAVRSPSPASYIAAGAGLPASLQLCKTTALHSPPLHERIQYYPACTGSRSSSSAMNSTERSVRCMRLELSAGRAEAQCSFEIGAWGVRGVE